MMRRALFGSVSEQVFGSVAERTLQIWRLSRTSREKTIVIAEPNEANGFLLSLPRSVSFFWFF